MSKSQYQRDWNAGDGRAMFNEAIELATHLGISVTLGDKKVIDV